MPWSFSFEIALMEHTGWSWDELQNTPVVVIQNIAARMASQSRAITLKAEMDKAEAEAAEAKRKAQAMMNRVMGHR